MDKSLLDITKKLTVLYVEDDKELRDNTIKLLSELFKEVDFAEDGKIGLEYYESYFQDKKEYYDLVITDIQMPNVNGIEMAKFIKGINEFQYILVFSAHNEVHYLEECIDIGIDGFIKKPYDFNDFISKIQKASLSISSQKHLKDYINQIDNLNKQLNSYNKELEKEVAIRTQKLEEQASTDTLTGYGNRFKLNQDIQRSICPALALLNIDKFSQINDFYGHEKGDEVIKKLGDIISSIIPKESCELYHLQGDEYVVFNQNITQESFLEKIEKLIHYLKTSKVILNNEEIYVQVSTAISFESKEKILTTANMARELGKRDNKSFVIYSEDNSLDSEYQNNLLWVKKIKEGLIEDRFIPIFQPIINNHNTELEKYECLVRLQEHNKLLSPGEFLEISKKTKHYKDITKMMLRKIFEIFKFEEVGFSINLTIEDIMNEDIKEYIFELLQRYKVGERVVFEIVESESIENFDAIQEFIEQIHEYGCKIAIDDFGTGYSNFEYLIKLKPNFIKIDGSLIKNIDINKEAELVVSTIVSFAKKMGIKTIAEYVESKTVLQKVKELDIDYSQGYYFGQPAVRE